MVIANDDSKLFNDAGGELSSVDWMNGAFSCGQTTDLTVESVTPNCGYLFGNESNSISAMIKNIGDADAGASNVSFVSGGYSETVSVSALAAGANETVTITDPTIRNAGDAVTITVTADCNGEVAESNEMNNVTTLDVTVGNNGYKSKNFAYGEEPLELHTYTEMYGGVVYNVSGEKVSPFELGETDTRVHTITVPSGMTVKEARLYMYWYNWGSTANPSWNVNFSSVTYATPNATYTDQKGFGSYDYPKGTYAYDVTSQVTESGDYTVIVENTGTNNKTKLLGEMLVVIYEDPTMNPDNWMKLWMLEGCDLLKGDEKYCVSTAESTATVTFPGGVDTANLNSAELITIVSQGQESGANKLINGATVATDVWNETTASKINVDVEDVTTLLVASDNTLGFEDTGTMGMQASCAILVAREAMTPPTLVTYTITNTTITPPQTTSIDVEFSEQVSAIIKIEDASGNLVNELYTSSGVTNPDPKTWDGTYTNGTTVPNGTYTVNVSGVSTTTGCSVVDTSKTITVGVPVPTVSIGSADNVSGTVPVSINITNASNIGAMDISVTYNATILTATGVANGSMIASLPDILVAHNISTEGEARMNFSFATYPGMINGTGELFVVTFRADAVGTSTLVITVTEAWTGEVPAQPVTVAVVNGAVTVTSIYPMIGDMDGSGEVTFDDVILLARHIYFGDAVLDDPDVDSIGGVTFDDVILLARHVYFGDILYP
jgi:hypothetical protein